MRHRNRLARLCKRLDALQPRPELRPLDDQERARGFIDWLAKVSERVERDHGKDMWPGEGGWRQLIAELRQIPPYHACAFFLRLTLHLIARGVRPPLPPDVHARLTARFLPGSPVIAFKAPEAVQRALDAF